MESYPSRPKFFSHRFCRLMAKVCLANEIGPECCWLLSIVAHTEDARGYRSAVTFTNGQLMPLVGINSDSTLSRARDRCIQAGWLHYEKGGTYRAGRYWVIIPSEYQSFDDLPTDEGEIILNRQNLSQDGNRTGTR